MNQDDVTDMGTDNLSPPRTSSNPPNRGLDEALDKILNEVYGVGYDQSVLYASGGGNNIKTSDTIYKAKTALKTLLADRERAARLDELDRADILWDRLGGCSCETGGGSHRREQPSIYTLRKAINDRIKELQEGSQE